MESSNQQKREGAEAVALEGLPVVATIGNDRASVLQRLITKLEPEENMQCACPRKQIVKAKDDIQELYTLKKAMDDMFEQKFEQKYTMIATLYDSLSPLLTLEHVCLKEILEYLDEGALFAAEQASFTLARIAAEYGHWTKLVTEAKKRYYEGLSNHFPNLNRHYYEAQHFEAPKRCYREGSIGDDGVFGSNVSFASNRRKDLPQETQDIAIIRCLGDYSGLAAKLERVGEQYYDYNHNASSSETTRKRKELAFHQSINQGFSTSMVEDPREEYCFVRISRGKSPPPHVGGDQDGWSLPTLIWQGFSRIDWNRGSDGFTVNMSHLMMGSGGKVRWPELQQLAEWQEDPWKTTEPEPPTRSVFQDARVSIVLNKKPFLTTGAFQCADIPFIQYVEGGDFYWDYENQRVYLQSRYDQRNSIAAAESALGHVVETSFSVLNGWAKMSVELKELYY